MSLPLCCRLQHPLTPLPFNQSSYTQPAPGSSLGSCNNKNEAGDNTTTPRKGVHQNGYMFGSPRRTKNGFSK